MTRRRFKPGSDCTAPPDGKGVARCEFTDGERVERVIGGSRERFRVGQTVAVQPGRGKRAIGRIRIIGITYDARTGDISEADARAEGFESAADYRAIWARMYGEAALDQACWAMTFVLLD